MVAWLAGSSRSGSSTPMRSTSAAQNCGSSAADAHVPAVGGLVDVVPGGAAVEQSRAAGAGVEAEGGEGRGHRVEVGRAVDDRGVDDLAPTARARLEERGEDADDEVGRAAAEVAEQVAREVRPVAVLAEAVEGAGDPDVVHVVARGLAPRPVLAPARHPADDQPLVAGVAGVRPEPEPLHRARAHPLDEHVGPLDEVEHGLDRLRPLEVERDARPAAVEHVGPPAGEHPAARPVDPHHVGAEVGQQHARVRPGPDARHLDHPHAPQRPGPLPQLVRHAPIMTPPLSGSRRSSRGRSARRRIPARAGILLLEGLQTPPESGSATSRDRPGAAIRNPRLTGDPELVSPCKATSEECRAVEGWVASASARHRARRVAEIVDSRRGPLVTCRE